LEKEKIAAVGLDVFDHEKSLSVGFRSGKVDDDNEVISVDNNTDIVLTKTVDDNTPNEGQNITFTVTVTNNGPAQATNLVINDVLPAGLTQSQRLLTV